MRVMIVEPSAAYIEMFTNRGHTLVDILEEADLIQFTGGSDVSPVLYGEEPHPHTYNSPIRDALEADIFKRAMRWSIPVAGICRGGQFLNVMNGGKMYQHVDGHAISDTHVMIGEEGREIDVTSTHHQMMVAGMLGEVLAVAYESTYRESMINTKKLGVGEIKRDTGDPEDTEVVLYPKTQSLCFQPHPEYLDKEHECQEYYFELLKIHLGVG